MFTLADTLRNKACEAVVVLKKYQQSKNYY